MRPGVMREPPARRVHRRGTSERVGVRMPAILADLGKRVHAPASMMTPFDFFRLIKRKTPRTPAEEARVAIIGLVGMLIAFERAERGEALPGSDETLERDRQFVIKFVASYKQHMKQTPVGRVGKHTITEHDAACYVAAEGVALLLRQFTRDQLPAEDLCEAVRIVLFDLDLDFPVAEIRDLMRPTKTLRPAFDPRKWINEHCGPQQAARALISAVTQEPNRKPRSSARFIDYAAKLRKQGTPIWRVRTDLRSAIQFLLSCFGMKEERIDSEALQSAYALDANIIPLIARWAEQKQRPPEP